MGWSMAGPCLCILALVIFRQGLAEDDTDRCLQEFKESVQDPENQLGSWKFGNSTEGYVCNFNGVTCWGWGENKILSIELQNAGLTGTFPSGLAQCKALQILDLSQNDFTGSIPSDLCKQIPYISSLDLSRNGFSGSIPYTLEDCQYLHDLKLDHNKLSGELPGGIGVLPKLTTLDVSSNLLTGPIPSSYGNRSPSPFPASTFSQNTGLCGPPLSSCKSCKSNIDLIVGIVAATAIVANLCTIVLLLLLRARKKKLNHHRADERLDRLMQ